MSKILGIANFKNKFEAYDKLKKVEKEYPFKVTEYYNSLIKKYSKNDPIYSQVFPNSKELKNSDNLSLDPFCEKNKQHANNLIHRYPNRSVLLMNNICAVNCRHCMRKRLWKKNRWELKRRNLNNIIKYCKKKQIEDIIISGGDPLMSSVELVEEVIARLSRLSNVKIIRIGSRLPVVDPERINNKIISIFKKYSKLLLLTHFNHPNEITDIAKHKIREILATSTPVFNQTVLLKGINDSSATLSKLFMKLIEWKVKPYYLHQCDLVKGVTHFWVEPLKGINILKELEGNISGLAIPYYAIDLPGGKGKVLLGPNSAIKKENSRYILRNYKNEKIYYSLK